MDNYLFVIVAGLHFTTLQHLSQNARVLWYSSIFLNIVLYEILTIDVPKNL